MSQNIFKISNQIRIDEVEKIYENNFEKIIYEFMNLEIEWMFNAYKEYKDLDKYLILVNLVHQTLETYNKHFYKLSFGKFYNSPHIEIEKISIIDLVKSLYMTKETVRRKLNELSKEGVLTRKLKNIRINKVNSNPNLEKNVYNKRSELAAVFWILAFLGPIRPSEIATLHIGKHKNTNYFDIDSKTFFFQDHKNLNIHGTLIIKLDEISYITEEQIDEFFVDGANDIVDCNEQVNIAMTEMQLGLRFQMFGQPFMTGVDSDKRIERAGSDQILDLPEGATYGIASPQGDINAVIENIKFQLDLVAQNNHLYVQFAQDGGETPSGIALKIKDLERFEDYQDDIELWRMYEHDFYHVEKHIAEYNGIKLPEQLRLDFNEPEYPKTVQDQMQ